MGKVKVIFLLLFFFWFCFSYRNNESLSRLLSERVQGMSERRAYWQKGEASVCLYVCVSVGVPVCVF